MKAWLSRALNSGYGCCYRCHTAWAWAQSHTTWYAMGWGCFPLCEGCWKALTPEERLPYYRRHWRAGLSRASFHDWWERWEAWLYMEDAVLRGR